MLRLQALAKASPQMKQQHRRPGSINLCPLRQRPFNRLFFFFLFSYCFSIHIGSPVWLMIFLLHMISPSPFPSPLSVQYCFKYCWHVSFHLVFRRRLFLFPGISVFNTVLSLRYSSLLVVLEVCCRSHVLVPHLVFACHTVHTL